MNESKPRLLAMSPQELAEFMLSLGEPKYRAEQLFVGLHRGLMPHEISNLGKATVKKLEESAHCFLPHIQKKLVSALDGTVKYLFAREDGNCVESVVMKYHHGNTICIS